MTLEEMENDLEARLAKLDPPYQTEQERQIGHTLDRYGIPFFYEQPTIIYDQGRRQIWYPDFSLPTYNGLLIEYAGRTFPKNQETSIFDKNRIYRANDIQFLFLDDTALQAPRWSADFFDRLEQLYQNPRGIGYTQSQRPVYRTPDRVQG